MKLIKLFFIFTTFLFAQTEPITTLSASFTQSVVNPSNQLIKYEGKVYVKQPNRMVWIYETPTIKKVYMNEQQITIVEPELEQAVFTTLKEDFNLIELINNPDKLDKKYKLTYKNNLIEKIEYKDEIDNKIEIDFTDIEINQNISDGIFTFRVPANYDIIRK